MTNIPHSLLDRLNKLKNLEEGARAVGSLEEANNAAGKYHALLLKHNLDESTVLEHGIKKKEEMLREVFSTDKVWANNFADWAGRLVKSVAYHCMCEVVWPKGMPHRLSIIGEKHNVGTAFYIIEQLISKIHIAFKIIWKEYLGKIDKTVFKKSFLVGAVEGIDRKLYDMTREATSQNTNMGLMVIDKRDKAAAYAQTLYSKGIKVVEEKKIEIGSWDGYDRGKKAGASLDINKGVGSNPKKSLD